MNFGEKLTNLRKQKGLSQEELGEELNVTRQTISKWELGQTSPDSAKLTEIANYFNVGVNELTNDETEVKYNDYSNNNSNNNSKNVGVIILIVILVLCLAGIVFYITTMMLGRSIFDRADKEIDKYTNKFLNIASKAKETFDEGESDKNLEITNTFLNTINKMGENYEEKKKKSDEEYNKAVNSMEEEYNKNLLNNRFKYMQGTKSKFMLSSYLDKIVTNNKTNSNHKISVVYNEKNTTIEDEIVEIKHSLKENTEYEVSLDYDVNGYIYKATIKDI